MSKSPSKEVWLEGTLQEKDEPGVEAESGSIGGIIDIVPEALKVEDTDREVGRGTDIDTEMRILRNREDLEVGVSIGSDGGIGAGVPIGIDRGKIVNRENIADEGIATMREGDERMSFLQKSDSPLETTGPVYCLASGKYYIWAFCF